MNTTLDGTHVAKRTPAAKRKEIARLKDMAAWCSKNIKNARARWNRAHFLSAQYGMEQYAIERYKKELALIRAAIKRVEAS